MTITREHITLTLLEECRLSRNDTRFLRYIAFLFSHKSPVTVNQNALWEVLVDKYKSQLVKKLSLSKNPKDSTWQIPVVESKPKTTVDLIYINSKWAIRIKGRDWDFKTHNDFMYRFKWSLNPAKKRGTYLLDFSIYALSEVIAFFNSKKTLRTFSDDIVAIMSLLGEQCVDSWQVTARYVNGRFVINNINETLLSLLPNSFDITLRQISEFAHHGIKVNIPEKLVTVFGKIPVKIASERVARIQAESSSDLILGIASAVKQLSINEPILIIEPNDISRDAVKFYDYLRATLNPNRCVTIKFASATRLVDDIITLNPAFVITGYTYIADHLIQLMEFRKLKTKIIVTDFHANSKNYS